MTSIHHEPSETDFPRATGRPAQRALMAAGYSRLEQLVNLSEAEAKQLHGVGPKAIEVLRQALKERGLAFANDKQ